ncbi:MAG: fumarylacetoacetate hydrolase family protein [Acidobacteriota bacterium]|nr:fumarylacetoacetate hydrolase family protein [Acidobacteriota bacterium]
MKICRFVFNSEIKIGVLEDERVYLFNNNQKSSVYFDRSKIKFLSPVVPSKIVCVGRNYAEHAAELGNEVPKEPLLFLKAPSALILDGESIVIPPQSDQVEHEGELAVVIGRKCGNLSDSDNPDEFIFGYTILNDVTARDLQRRDIQFTRAKSFDTFCPIASFIETDLDTSNLSLTTRVNGIVKQQGKTSQMVFPVEILVRYISRQMTLNEGDIIATGTPSGVSKLEDADICEIEIEGIGILSNPVIKTFPSG